MKSWSRRVSVAYTSDCVVRMDAHSLTGPTGLTMLKMLREDGFNVTLYERRSRVGGLLAYSENHHTPPGLQLRLPLIRWLPLEVSYLRS